jgi:hypothetical protein
MESSFNPGPTKGVAKMFNACSYQILEFEEYLSGEASGKQRPVHPPDQSGYRWVDESNNDYTRRRGIINSMSDDDIKVVNYDEGRGNAHAVILIRNKFLPNGWGFFDANGKEGFKESILRFHNKDGIDVTDEYLSVTPDSAFNSALFMGTDKKLPEDYNPGFCGIFSIIFMVFYKKYKDRPDWIELWRNVCNCFLLPYSHDAKGNYKFALAVARDALAIVNEPIPLPAKEHHILSLLNQACEFESSPMDAGRKRRKRKTPKQKTPKQKTPKQKTPKHRKKRKSYKRR